MLRTSPFLCSLPSVCLCAALLCGCGYTLRGMQGYGTEVLGNGSKTLRIADVDQTTVFPWIPYVVKSSLNDGILERRLAKTVPSGASDFIMTAKITDYDNSNENEASGASYLYTVRLSLELVIRDGKTNREIWRSGGVSYSDSFQTESEEKAIRQVAAECIRRALDRLDQKF